MADVLDILEGKLSQVVVINNELPNPIQLNHS